jgi:hypothetical protein
MIQIKTRLIPFVVACISLLPPPPAAASTPEAVYRVDQTHSSVGAKG